MNKPCLYDFEFSIFASKPNKVAIQNSHTGVQVALEKHAEQTLASHKNAFVGSLKSDTDRLQYSLVLDDDRLRPDPTSLFLPHGVHGPSERSLRAFDWSDQHWRGERRENLIIYELHLGTFTQEGTLNACIEKLDYLIDLGINTIELMPLAQCPGRWNWGYDGVALYAVNHNYGTPEDLKRFINICHQKKLSVILDVVYNHLGPEGNYLGEFGPYLSKKHSTPWGAAFNFDGQPQRLAREYVINNALFWLEEYHFDGLRLDAIHFMFDDSPYPITKEICQRVRTYEQSISRPIHMIGESNVYEHELLFPQSSKASENSDEGYSAIWADDLMHSIYSLAGVSEELTPRDYQGFADAEECLNYGYIYTGPKTNRVDLKRRQQSHGETLADKRYISHLIMALQTHDSAGNHPQGKRIHQLTSLSFQKAAACLFLLYPAIPMIFMGEEFATDTPFLFFSDFGDKALRQAVDSGRAKDFPMEDWNEAIKPSDERAFFQSKLLWPDEPNSMLIWYKTLISLRKSIKAQGLMEVEKLRVRSDQQRGIFLLEYRTNARPFFILVRLNPVNVNVDEFNVTVNQGAILLDSNQRSVEKISDEHLDYLFSDRANPTVEDPGHKMLALTANHAVVGVGNVTFY